MLAAFTTRAHFFVSESIRATNASGVPPTRTEPVSSSVFCARSESRALANSALSLSMIARGVPAGATMPL
jgi:hypothetical protein